MKEKQEKRIRRRRRKSKRGWLWWRPLQGTGKPGHSIRQTHHVSVRVVVKVHHGQVCTVDCSTQALHLAGMPGRRGSGEKVGEVGRGRGTDT